MADRDPSWPPPDNEIEVLRLHMAGFSDAAIAHRLAISLTTVRRRALRARRRAGARTRAEAIAALVTAGLIDVPRPPG
jgi:DNA-binding NarL/FixJ family response regulator